jgi:hypothetical protein
MRVRPHSAVVASNWPRPQTQQWGRKQREMSWTSDTITAHFTSLLTTLPRFRTMQPCSRRINTSFSGQPSSIFLLAQLSSCRKSVPQTQTVGQRSIRSLLTLYCGQQLLQLQVLLRVRSNRLQDSLSPLKPLKNSL